MENIKKTSETEVLVHSFDNFPEFSPIVRSAFDSFIKTFWNLLSKIFDLAGQVDLKQANFIWNEGSESFRMSTMKNSTVSSSLSLSIDPGNEIFLFFCGFMKIISKC